MAEINYCANGKLATNRLLLETLGRKDVLAIRDCIGDQCNNCVQSYCIKVESTNGTRVVISKDAEGLLKKLGRYSH